MSRINFNWKINCLRYLHHVTTHIIYKQYLSRAHTHTPHPLNLTLPFLSSARLYIFTLWLTFIAKHYTLRMNIKESKNIKCLFFYCLSFTITAIMKSHQVSGDVNFYIYSFGVSLLWHTTRFTASLIYSMWTINQMFLLHYDNKSQFEHHLR